MLPAPSRAFGLLLAALAVPVSVHAQDTAIPEARASLARLGVDMRHVDLTIAPSDKPSYRMRIRHGAITAQGSSAIASVHGVAQVLERQGALSVTWKGRRHAPLPAKLTCDSGTMTSPFALRADLNICTYGDTTPWWS